MPTWQWLVRIPPEGYPGTDQRGYCRGGVGVRNCCMQSFTSRVRCSPMRWVPSSRMGSIAMATHQRANALLDRPMLSAGRTILLLLAGLHLVGSAVSLPLLDTASDFASYYTAGWAIRSGEAVYPWRAVLESAEAQGVSPAAHAMPYRYLPAVALAFAPLTLLPYIIAKWVWVCMLIAAAVGCGVLLARMYGERAVATVALCVTFAPISVGLCWGNISCSLPLALVLLALGGLGHRPKLSWLAGFAALGIAKLFPLLWLWVPGLLRRWRAIGIVGILVVGIAAAALLNPPNATPSTYRSFLDESAWIVAPLNARLGHLSVWSATLQLTQPVEIDYEAHGLDVHRVVPAVFALRMRTAALLGMAATALALVACLWLASRMVAARCSTDALWFLASALCVVLPVAFYSYQAVMLPGLVAGFKSLDGRARQLAVASYALVGIGRFHGYLAAVFPHTALALLLGAVGPVVLCASLYRNCQIGLDKRSHSALSLAVPTENPICRELDRR